MKQINLTKCQQKLEDKEKKKLKIIYTPRFPEELIHAFVNNNLIYPLGYNTWEEWQEKILGSANHQFLYLSADYVGVFSLKYFVKIYNLLSTCYIFQLINKNMIKMTYFKH